jgi:hydroxymethylbilane synthase
VLQAEHIVWQLKQRHPDLEFTIEKVKTTGDRARKAPLAQIGGQGVFTKELEEALLAGDIDLAVHSLKDVPTEMSSQFRLAAVGMRADPRDVLISRSGACLAGLPKEASVGTGSLRRAIQLRALRPDIRIYPLRGNIDTRLGKVGRGELDGVVLAAAAMVRLGWVERIAEYLAIEHCLPAVGQGALAVEVRGKDAKMCELAAVCDHEPTRQSVAAERAFLQRLGGGCQAPIAALGVVADGSLKLEGMISNVDGSKTLRASQEGSPGAAEQVGRILAHNLLEMGAGELIAGAG